MKVLKREEMQFVDHFTINQIGIPGIVLMENAAIGVVNEIKKINSINSVCICCGLGNNGGDGFAIARLLDHLNIDVSIIVIGDIQKINGDARINFNICKKLKLDIINIKGEMSLDICKARLVKSDIVVDAIFGTGLQRPVTGLYYEIIKLMNKINNYKISVDIPSGIDANNGKVQGIAIKANKTVTFCLPKIGLLLYPGHSYIGELIIADIGIPKEAINVVGSKTNIIDEKLYFDYLPKRQSLSHKGTYGKVLVIAGSHKMAGAGILTTKATYRTGAGLVKTFTESAVGHLIINHVPESVIETYNRTNNMLLEEDQYKLINSIKWADVIAIGPGLGNDKITEELLRLVLSNSNKSIIIDADALNVLAQDLEILKTTKAEIVITPHIGEMSRLTKSEVNDILNNTIHYATNFSKTYNVTCVLKSARTITSLPSGETFINIHGNSGMATAGSGDVLTGIIASLMAQGVRPSIAAPLGVYCHSKAGDRAKEIKGEYGLMAHDIIENIPYVMK